jgi:glycosyltransferase involved in cell wall biosynthesis
MVTNRNRILTTCAWSRPQWRARADVIEAGSPFRVVKELLARARDYPVVVLDGSIHRDQVAAFLLSMRRPRPKIVILDATWKLSDRALDRTAMRLAIRTFDGPHMTYCVLSRFEQSSFKESWGVDSARVMFTPWLHTLTDAKLAAPTDESEGIVALGDSLRDYATLLEAAEYLPDRVTIATRTLPSRVLRALPPNVNAGPVGAARYDELMRRASIIVIPLEARTDRSAGQTTYINAMALGKPLVITGTAGVDDYIRHGETGWIVPPGDPKELCHAIEALLHDPEEARAMGERARADALCRFTPERYVEEVLAVVSRVSA